MRHLMTTVLATAFLTACGGGEQAQTGGEQAPATPEGGTEQPMGGQMMTPDWMQVDNDARTVTLDIVAGQTNANNNWNFNGYHTGNATITVPEGYAVTINFRNSDPAIAHSLGIASQVGNYPPMFQDPQPVFEGAMTSNPTDVQNATRPGATETVTFTAGTAGEYAMVCYVPAHATAGMWISFNVSADGQAGVTTTG